VVAVVSSLLVCLAIWAQRQTFLTALSPASSASTASTTSSASSTSPASPNTSAYAPKNSESLGLDLDYAGYKRMARKKGFFPIDPIDKLDITLRGYTQITSLNKQSETILSYLDSEIFYLMGVFQKTEHRTIDLTNSTFLALKAAHQFSYALLKMTLAEGYSRVVTLESINQIAGSYIYTPSLRIITLALTQPNVKLDFTKRVDGHTLLATAVRSRLYGVFSALMRDVPEEILGDALPVAVLNGDDLAVAIILKIRAQNALAR
jgi:hypothetical protein